MTRYAFFLAAAMLVAAVVTTSPSGAETAVTIQDAYDSAFRTYEAAKIAEEGVTQAESRVDQAWSSIYPRITASSSYTRYNESLPPGSDTGVFQPLTSIKASATLTQPLYTGGRTLAALRIAKSQVEGSRHDQARVRQWIILGVSKAYFGVLRAMKNVEISRASLGRMERHRSVTEREAATRRTKANASSLLRADTLVSQARITLVRAEEAARNMRKQLSLLTGLPEEVELTEPQPAEPSAQDLASLEETALQNRDDYAGVRLSREQAKEYVTVVEGAHYPQISAEGNISYTDSSPATILDGTIYYGLVKITVPLFEGGLMKAESAEIRSKYRQAELSEVLLKRTIENEVHEAHLHYQTAIAVLETSKLQLDYARRNFDAVEGLFAEGLVPSLSLIDAEQALSLAEKDYMNTTYDREIAIVDLQNAIGLLGKR